MQQAERAAPGPEAPHPQRPDGAGRPGSWWRLSPIRGSPPTDASAVEMVDQRGLLPAQQVTVDGGQRCQGVDQDLPARNVDHAARVDPTSRAPDQTDATFEAAGLGRMEAVLVGANGLVAHDAEPTDAVENRPAIPSLAPGLPAGGCSSCRHGDHSAPGQPHPTGAGGPRLPGSRTRAGRSEHGTGLPTPRRPPGRRLRWRGRSRPCAPRPRYAALRARSPGTARGR